MSWPTPQEYNEAIQTPLISFSDPELQKGTVELTPIGIPKAMTGAFASVYKITTRGGDWAVRCFLNDRPEQKERYEKISQHVLMDNLKYTVEFHYLEQGIKVRGKWFPILKMNWVEGPTFENYLIDNFRDTHKLNKLKEDFSNLAKSLDEAGMAHGDLQHGNMIITDDGIKLIDYDAIYVPKLNGKLSLEAGHPNYQHPLRNATQFDTFVDNFSCWLIDHSLEIVSIDPELISRFSGGDECILLRQKDLHFPEKSPVFKALINHKSERINELTTTIIRMLWATPEIIPELHKPEELIVLPRIKPTASANNINANTVTVSNIVDGSQFHKDQMLDWQTPEEVEYARDTSPYRIGKFKKLVNKFQDILENFDKTFTPMSWVESKKEQAEYCLKDGKYREAISKNIEAFQYLSQKLDESSLQYGGGSQYGLELINVSLKLGQLLTLTGDIKIATNYFYVAHQNAIDFEGNGTSISTVVQTSVLLAINRYSRGNRKEALALVNKREDQVLDCLECMIKKSTFRDMVFAKLKLNQMVFNLTFKSALLKKYNDIIESEEALNLFLDYRDSQLVSKDPHGLNILFVLCADIYSQIRNSTKIETDRKVALLFLEIANRNYNSRKLDLAKDSIRIALDIMLLILKKIGKSESDLSGSKDCIHELFVLSGLHEAFKTYKEIADFSQSVLNIFSLEKDVSFSSTIAQLEDSSEKERNQWINNAIAEQGEGTFDFEVLLNWTSQKGYHQTYKSLERALLQYGKEEEIIDHIELLSSEKLMDTGSLVVFLTTSGLSENRYMKINRELIKYPFISSKPLKKILLKHCVNRDLISQIDLLSNQEDQNDIDLFLTTFKREMDEEKILRISRSLSAKSYYMLLDQMNKAVCASGDVNDIIRHLNEIGGKRGLPRAVNFIIELIALREYEIIGEVFSEIIDTDFDDLIANLYKKEPEILHSLFIDYFQESEIIAFTNFLVENYQIDKAKELVASLVEKRDSSFLAGLFDFASKHTGAGPEYILFFIYMAGSEQEKWTQVDKLIREKNFDALKKLLFRLSYIGNHSNLEWLLKKVKKPKLYKYLQSPVPHVHADKFISTAINVSLKEFKNKKQFSYHEWEKQFVERLEKAKNREQLVKNLRKIKKNKK